MAKTPKTLRQEHRSKAAYTLVDLSDLDKELREDIILDANEGGGIYGVRVVEEAINGGARAPIYGVYNDGPDADRWSKAKDKLGLSGEQVDDSEVYGGSGIEVADPRREAALRQAAAEKALGDAEALRSAERNEVAAITGDSDEDAAARRAPALDHSSNIVDPGAIDAENEASNIPADAGARAAAKNKAPK